MNWRQILKAVIDEARHADIDLDRAGRVSWFHRPFTHEELADHPDRDRIQATIEAVAADVVCHACAVVESNLDGGGAP